METNRKVVAAIGAAVTTYIEEEKAAARDARKRPAHPSAPGAWSVSGRQEIMRNRQLWQLRIVPG
jgi:hypothetical protein